MVVKEGTVLREGHLAIFAALGITEVKVYQIPTVGILSTGNEIVPHSTKELKIGEIRDINSLALGAIANKFGAEVIQGGIVRDNYTEILNKASQLLDRVDILLLSGGSSVGTLDFTERVIKTLSPEDTLVEGIAVKPGKPTIISKLGNKVIWGLPGHPVSAMMIFSYFGKQLLSLLSGSKELKLEKIRAAKLNRNIPSNAGRSDLVMIKVEEDETSLIANPLFGKSSIVRILSDSDGYIEVPLNKEGLEAGEIVDVILWD